MTPDQVHTAYAFGRFVLDVDRGVLRDDTGELRLRPKAFEVLRFLVERPGRLVSREELHDAVWGHTVVTDDALAQCIGEIRRVLGDAERALVSTVPRRGYRFELPVRPWTAPEPVARQPALQQAAAPRPPAPRARPTPRKLGRPLGEHRPAGKAVRRIVLATRVVAWIALAIALAIWWSFTRLEPNTTAAPESAMPGAPLAAGSPQETAAAAASPNSIAVLPFVDLSPARDQEYFGDGLAEEILNQLAQSPELKVIARTSSFAFKGRAVDIATIAAVLGVNHVLEGSVRVAGERVRVTAQLISVSDSAHLWSQTYDRALDDVLNVQSEIAVAVAGVLRATLVGPAVASEREGTRDLQAYDHYLRARFLFNRRSTGDLQRAVAQYEAAVAADPGFAVAWAGLSGALNALIHDEGEQSEANLARRREAAEQALALDPSLPEAHLRIAPLLWEAGEVEAAERHLQSARVLDPENLLLLTLGTGDLLASGQLEEASDRWQRAIARDPLSVVYRMNHASVLAALHRFDEARLELAVVAELAPARRDAVALVQARMLVLEGRAEEALAALTEAASGYEHDAALVLAEHALDLSESTPAALERLATDPSPDGALGLAEIYAGLGEIDSAARWLDEACARFRADLTWGEVRCARMANVSPFLTHNLGTLLKGRFGDSPKKPVLDLSPTHQGPP